MRVYEPLIRETPGAMGIPYVYDDSDSFFTVDDV